ncbi:MAG: Protoheme IX farnesyltransferase [Chlamydiae bacterium]|nr:Protoheme IX farnesyltransferase [Chlamydiota bacterium]
MERLSRPTRSLAIRAYCALAKPGIIMGNALTAAGGFALASRGLFDFWLFLATMEGLALVIASACVFNNYIDRELDGKMERTKNRPLVKGLISPRSAMVFATILGLLGTLILALFTNLITVMVALIGVIVYVALYSLSKYRTVYGTLIGSIAGATPPVVGYCAVTGQFDLAALILFTMIVMWQMPHFYAIAIYRLEDYARGSIPIYPIKKGILATKIQMLLYIVAFIAASSLLTLLGYTGYAYLTLVTLLGAVWLYLALKGFKCANDQHWARKMFIFSLLIVTALSVAIPFSVR